MSCQQIKKEILPLVVAIGRFVFIAVFTINSVSAQTISGKFMGDLVRNFKFNETSWYVDGFGSKKMVAIEYTQYKKLETYKFKTDSYVAWFDITSRQTYLNVGWTHCKSCKSYKFNVKTIKTYWK